METDKICGGCGAPMAAGVKFCTKCGRPVSIEELVTLETPAEQAPEAGKEMLPSPAQPGTEPPEPLESLQPAEPQQETRRVEEPHLELPPPKGSPYAPISAGGFFGIMLLMLVPVVNIILLIVWACGGCRKVNKSNWARAMLVFLLAAMILGFVWGMTGARVLRSFREELRVRVPGISHILGVGESELREKGLSDEQIPLFQAVFQGDKKALNQMGYTSDEVAAMLEEYEGDMEKLLKAFGK